MIIQRQLSVRETTDASNDTFFLRLERLRMFEWPGNADMTNAVAEAISSGFGSTIRNLLQYVSAHAHASPHSSNDLFALPTTPLRFRSTVADVCPKPALRPEDPRGGH